MLSFLANFNLTMNSRTKRRVSILKNLFSKAKLSGTYPHLQGNCKTLQNKRAINKFIKQSYKIYLKLLTIKS